VWGTGCGQGVRERPGLNPRPPPGKKKSPEKQRKGRFYGQRKKKTKVALSRRTERGSELSRALAMAFCTMRE